MDVVTVADADPVEVACTATECDSASQDSGIASISGTEGDALQKFATVANLATCPLQDNSSKVEFNEKGTLWAEGWRKGLCRCDTCKVRFLRQLITLFSESYCPWLNKYFISILS